MPPQLLATKLHLPTPRPDAVARPRLIERLDDGLHRRLTLLSAPAGFGKTTLAAAWLAGCGRPAAWLSLDPGDRDPARFLAYLVAALRPLGADTDDDPASAGAVPAREAALTALVNDLQRAGAAGVLVLDDYHLADAPEVDRIVGFLLEHLPTGLHLAIATREDPSLPLARLRARDQLTEIRAADLRFTPDETAAFFDRTAGGALSGNDLAALGTRTEGWAAGLQLAAVSLRGRDDPRAFVDAFTGSHRFVVDYLVEEVLLQQSEAVQEFLLRTSILDRMCAELCDAVLADGAATGRDRLADLERANLLVVPLDDARVWYRYHPLFAEVLRARLEQLHPGAAAELHRRAGAWFEAQGSRDEAVRHALAGGDHDRAATIVETSWLEVHAEHRYATVSGWLEALPDALRSERPGIGVAAAWTALMVGRLEQVEPLLDEAEHTLETSTETEPVARHALRTTITAARAYLAQARGDLEGTIAHARTILDDPVSADDSADDPWTGAAATLLGLAEWTRGDLVAAERTLSANETAFRRQGRTVDAISVGFVLAEVRVGLGRLRDAVAACQSALHLADALDGNPPPDAADVHRTLADIRCERGDLDAAERQLRLARALGERATLPDWEHRLATTEGRLAWARGDIEGALERFERAERSRVRTPLPDVRPAGAWKARALVALGRWREAAAWARSRGLAPDDALGYDREFEQLTLARVLLTQHAETGHRRVLAAAAELLERLLAAAEAADRSGSVVEARTLLALARHARGDTDAALDVLEPALATAEAEGYQRLFLDQGGPLARLLEAAAERGLYPAYLGALRAGFDVTAPGPPADALEEPLTDREFDVLRLIAEGRSNQEIADRLEIALSTVKGYNRNLFGKLLVDRRTEAVAKARELGLL